MATIDCTVVISAADSADLTRCTDYLNAHLPENPGFAWTVTQDAPNLKVTATQTVTGVTL